MRKVFVRLLKEEQAWLAELPEHAFTVTESTKKEVVAALEASGFLNPEDGIWFEAAEYGECTECGFSNVERRYFKERSGPRRGQEEFLCSYCWNGVKPRELARGLNLLQKNLLKAMGER